MHLNTKQGIRAKSRDDLLGNMLSISDKSLLASNFQQTLNALGVITWVAAELEIGWNQDGRSRQDKRSSKLRTAKPKNLDSKPTVPIVVEGTE